MGGANRRTGRASAAQVLCLTVFAAFHTRVAAQIAPSEAPPPSQPASETPPALVVSHGIDPYDITGRTFAGVKFPLATTPGKIELGAQRAWGWSETETIAGRTCTARRIELTGDVRLTLGGYSLSAAKAAIWLAHPEGGETGAEGAGDDVWQVFAVLDQPSGAEGAAPIAISGGRLPVRGIIKAPEGVKLKADVFQPGRPADTFVAASERVLAARLRAIVAPPPAPLNPEELLKRGDEVPPMLRAPAVPEQESLESQRRDIEDLTWRLPAPRYEEPIFAQTGIISISAADKIVATKEDGRWVAVLNKSAIVRYWEKKRDRTLQVSGERAVIFFDESAGDEVKSSTSFGAGKVRGFYVEGGVVAEDGEHTIRAPRVYYDVKRNRAILIDAVFWTFDQKRALSLYMRAESIEQLSIDQFRATEARMSNTPFFDPDLSIGAGTVTISRQGEPGDRSVFVDARDITLRVADIPFFYWPILQGDPGAIPLKDIRIETEEGSGTALKTTWNAYSLLGIKPQRGDEASVMLDVYSLRGVGLGSLIRWGPDKRLEDIDHANGSLFDYFLPSDHGTDILPTGQRISHDGEARGMIYGEHRADLSENWSLFAEGSYISDPNFVAAFFEPLARDHREFTNSLYLRRTEDNTLLSGEVRGRSTDFIPNEYLLQTPGYSVAKYPDLAYYRLADDLFDGHPGLLTYSSSYRFTQMRMQFVDPKVSEFGFASPFQSEAFFGIKPGESIADALRAQGLTQEPIARLDTRHEVSMQLAAGPLNITPFAVGRATVYDDNFESFSPQADQNYRMWGAEGITVSTELTHIDDSVESSWLDLHRIRHIIQPSVTVWHADTTVERKDLPIFDDEVEDLAEGTATKFAIDQTWQTQRGGPGRWRSVDVFKLDASLVVASGDVNKTSPIGQFFDYQPELSVIGGTYGTLEGSWQVSEVLGIGGMTVFDFDINQQAKTAIGYTLQHSSDFITTGEIRYINSQNQTYAILGAYYQITSKYTISGSTSYDTVRDEFQSFSFDIRRRFPNVILGTGVSYNNITGVTSFGLVFQPVGVTRPGAQIRGLGGAPGTGGFGL